MHTPNSRYWSYHTTSTFRYKGGKMQKQPVQTIKQRQQNTTSTRSWLSRHRDTIEGYAFLLPFLVAYGLFLLYPFAKGVWISLFDWNLLAVTFNPNAKEFLGLDNFRTMLLGRDLTWSIGNLGLGRLLGLGIVVTTATWFAVNRTISWLMAVVLASTALVLFGGFLGIHPSEDGRWLDRRFWPIVANTVIFVLGTVPAITVLALGIAVALNREGPLASVLRTLFFLSQVLSVTVVTLIWQLMYSPSQGILANVFRAIGLEPITWITNPTLAMPAIIIATVWWSLGFAMVLFIAGLQEIPNERYEAARLDGANGWQTFRFITLPGISRTITLVVVFEIILHFQVFGQSHLITGGGPNDATQTLVRYIYQTAFRDSQLGYASALAVFLFAIMMVFSTMQMRLNREPR